VQATSSGWIFSAAMWAGTHFAPRGGTFFGSQQMLQFGASTLTIFAVFITTPKSLLPSAVMIGLTAICVIAIAVALVGAFKRDNRNADERHTGNDVIDTSHRPDVTLRRRAS
jgi:hypothetical protein